MSITFSFSNSPRVSIQHPCDDEPEGFWVERADVWPSANFANSNANNLLRLLGLDPTQEWGELAPSDIPAVMARAITARNLARARSSAIIEPEISGNYFNMGSDDDSVVRRLDQMMELLKFAVDNNETLSWG